jgi:hypoxanthine phosphoribosyltransferase
MPSKTILPEEVKNIVDNFVGANKEFLAGIDFVAGVSRGGLVPAALLALAIDKPLVAVYINKHDEIFFDRMEWIKNRNILVVDDIIRSGKTLWLIKSHLEKFCPAKSISFFVLFKVKPLVDNSYNMPVFSQEINEDVIFPWD